MTEQQKRRISSYGAFNLRPHLKRSATGITLDQPPQNGKKEVYTTTYFEHARCHVRVPSRPHLFNELCIGFCNFPFHSQRVVSVDFSLIFIFEEVVGQWCSVAQALKEDTIRAHTPSGKHTERNQVIKGQWGSTPNKTRFSAISLQGSQL